LRGKVKQGDEENPVVSHLIPSNAKPRRMLSAMNPVDWGKREEEPDCPPGLGRGMPALGGLYVRRPFSRNVEKGHTHEKGTILRGKLDFSKALGQNSGKTGQMHLGKKKDCGRFSQQEKIWLMCCL